MITGSPLNESFSNSSFAAHGHHNQPFLPNYLLGTQPDSNRNQNTPSRPVQQGSIPKCQYRVTWSPELNRTAYYEVNNGTNSSAGSAMDSFAAPDHNSIPRSPFISGNASFSTGPPTRTLFNTTGNDVGLNQSTSDWQNSSTFPCVGELDSAKNDDCCVTIFGLLHDSLNFILQQFSAFGTILKYEAPAKCNWIHVKFQSRLQAAKALEKNGRIFNSCMQIGVIPCLDKEALSRLNPKANNMTLNESSLFMSPSYLSNNDSRILTPNRQHNNISTNNAAKPNMRLLTAKNLDAQSGLQEDGLIAKARHYILGW